ncbi:hypothetical protein NE237_032621 [Protea cynaroides]|uniref:Uncharacterized protein n=1 Tax=Protea cynaroides TaxID=273540 RepID=A0A9Q0L3Q5_9MAGN|nr:hypothetical protein NE237_032621 [Protea cynaroides]
MLAVARAFLYLAVDRIDKRHRMMAKFLIRQDMTVAHFLAADIDNDGFVSKSEYVIYKLKEMGKAAEKDNVQICNQFDKLDTGNCGKITLADLVEGLGEKKRLHFVLSTSSSEVGVQSSSVWSFDHFLVDQWKLQFAELKSFEDQIYKQDIGIHFSTFKPPPT